MKQKYIFFLTLLLIMGFLSGCNKNSVTQQANTNSTNTNSTITFTNDSITNPEQTVSISDSVVTISKGGTYTLTGSSENAQVKIDAEDEDVLLIFDNLTLSCQTSAPVYVKEANQVTITLTENTTNTLSTTDEYEAIDDNNIDGAIFSKDDLIFNGLGTLAIDSPYGHGIVSKDTIEIQGGTYTMTCKKHGISGKDGILISDGTFTLNTQKDGIHTDGDLTIEYGDINIEESLEGLEGQTITILDGNISINSSDDGINAASSSDNTSTADNQMPNEGTTPPELPDNMNDNENMEIPEDGTTPPELPDNMNDNENMEIPEDGATPPELPDNMNDNENMEIPEDGTTPPELPDNMNDGENQNRKQPGGGQAFGGGFDLDADESCSLTISGGNIYINASGDGIDSNGTFTMTGGVVFVEGPENNGNSALDYGISASISGGYFTAIGYSGMAQSFGNDSTQCFYSTTLSDTIKEVPSTLTLSDGNGNLLITQDTSKTYNHIVISCPELKEGETFQLTTGSTTQDITVTSRS